MEVLMHFMGIACGVAILVKSADWFTGAAVEIARRFKVPEIIVGATLVSLATTMPEFAVSLIAALQGQVARTVGNALGSTICNTGLILGLCALLAAMGVDRKGFLPNGLSLLVFAAIFGAMAYAFPDGSTMVGVVMLLCLVVFLTRTVRASLRGQSEEEEVRAAQQAVATVRRMVLLFAGGAVGIVAGSKLTVYCAENLARRVGISELVISLTLLALGTSLPELVVSVAGIIKKQRALAIGNIIGANILNLAWVIGACSLVRPLPLQKSEHWGHQIRQSLVFDIPVMLTLSGLLLIFGLTGKRLSRAEGAVLLAIYIAYVAITYSVFGRAAV